MDVYCILFCIVMEGIVYSLKLNIIGIIILVICNGELGCGSDYFIYILVFDDNIDIYLF